MVQASYFLQVDTKFFKRTKNERKNFYTKVCKVMERQGHQQM
jgi:hypothetical protein